MSSSTDEPDKLLDTAALCVSSPEDPIEIRDFLDFLILAYRINDVLTSDREKKNIHDNNNIDWTELSRNNLFLRLSDGNGDAEGEIDKQIMPSASIERVQCVLKHRLKDIMNEGILDSVLPFIVKKSLTTNVLKTIESIGSKISNPQNKEKICSKQKLNTNDSSSRSKGE